MKLVIAAVLLIISLVCFTVDAKDRSNLPACVCPRIYDPQCATDGETYANMCEFECYQKARSPSLRIAHRGACEEDEELIPVEVEDILDNVVLV